MNATKLNIKNIMLIWTVLLILAAVINVITGGFSYGMGGMPTNTP